MTTSTKQRPRRRSPGEGSVFEYRLAGGQLRYGVKFTVTGPDGSRRQVLRRRDGDGQPFTTRKAASAALREALAKVSGGTYVEPAKQPLGEYLAEWLAGQGHRLAPSTVASYRKVIRVHVTPRLGAVPLASLTAAKLNGMYRDLEQSGRADHKAGQPLSARSVRYVHQILHRALASAVRSKLLSANPADSAEPPSSTAAKAPEMRFWSAAELAAFLGWARSDSTLYAAWHVLALTGMRRGELLAMTWRDVDLTTGTLTVQRSLNVIKTKGEPERLEAGKTKTKKPRGVDLDAATVTLLRAHRAERGGLALALIRDDAPVFGDANGAWLHPERFSRQFGRELARCAKALGDAAPPVIRLHDLRHTAASLMLGAGVPVHVVSKRLGHANPSITFGVYSHVMPGMQREAAELLAALVGGN